MPRVDQFESVFKAAVRTPYAYERQPLASVVVVSDLPTAEAEALAATVKTFTGAHGAGAKWHVAAADESDTVEHLLDLVERTRPDLVVSYRNVHTQAWQWPHSLGRHLDILTQATEVPVLVIPHPADTQTFAGAMQPPAKIMAVTTHLDGDGSLVNAAVSFSNGAGTLMLTHVEDDATFERYMDTIAKIPAIDTQTARDTILQQLLKEPRDYVEAVRQALAAAGIGVQVEAVIENGHRAGHYRQLIAEHDVDLLVLHTKDDDQDAMHGVAYPLAIELRSLPLLML